MSGRVRRLITVCSLIVCVPAALAFGQGTATSSLSGVVVDSNGGVLPGATVAVKNNATGVTLQLVTNAAGAFSAPSIDAGTYTVTVTESGFKTAVVSDVKLVAATPANLPKITLDIGNVSET